MNGPFHIQKNPATIERTHLRMPKLSKKAILSKEYEAILELCLGKDKYFDQNEYLLGDSAFSTSAVMIPAFKKDYNLNKERKY